MKKIFSTLLIALLFSGTSFAQRFVYVDTEYILDRMPEYKKAQDQLDQITEAWRKEIDEKYKEIDKLYKAYQAEQILLTEDMKVQKQKEIEEKEKAARELQKQRFGYEGDLFKKKQELIKPVQDKVYKEIQKMAEEKAYDFVFDKSSSIAMLYATPKYDRSEEILKAMGIVGVPANSNAGSATQSGSTKPSTSETKPATAPAANEPVSKPGGSGIKQPVKELNPPAPADGIEKKPTTPK
jgi:outer membrane protein